MDQVWLEKRYVGSRHTSEWFNTAGRNVKTGLIASVIVSQVMDSNSLIVNTLMNLRFHFFTSLFFITMILCSGHGLLQSCKALMLHGSMELVDLSGMLVGPPSRHEPYISLEYSNFFPSKF